MVKPAVSHDRFEESQAGKAEWFQSMTKEERLDYFCDFTELIISCNPEVLETRHAGAVPNVVQIVERP
jgi:hypothetical protein